MKNERSCTQVHDFRDLVQGCLVTSFSACGSKEHDGAESMELKCLQHGNQEAERERGKEGRRERRRVCQSLREPTSILFFL